MASPLLLALVLAAAPDATAVKLGPKRHVTPAPEPAPLTCVYPDKEALRRAVHRHAAELGEAYARARAAAPGPDGKLVLRFTLDGAGHVTAAEVVSSELGLPAFEAEVLAMLRGWQLPAFRAPLTFTYPVLFRSR